MKMVVQLDEELWFPDPRYGEEDGLIAVGGDLSVDRLLLAYSHGIFPWYAFRYRPQIQWYCPLRRFVIMPSEIHISHSMRQLLRNSPYRLSINEDFHGVITQCSLQRIDEEGAWLGPEMVEAYEQLHQQGFAASVEVWQADGTLAGGLYGVCVGRGFYGESMFSSRPNASKLALIHLARTMQTTGGALIDCQFETPHLRSMGGRYILYDEYLRLISDE